MKSEELLEVWNSIQSDIVLTKKINQSKLLRQLEIFQEFRKLKGKGYAECCTRFGKTMIAIIAIKRMLLKNDHATTNVIVPAEHLYNDWVKEDGHINTFNLKNVNVYIVNSYVLSDIQWECDFLVLDEVHRYANDDSQYFSTTLRRTNYKHVLGLSATLDRQKREFLHNHGLYRAGIVTLQEAERKGWVAKHYMYNLGLELKSESEKEQYKIIQDIYDSNFEKFNRDWDKASACRIGNNKTYMFAEVNGRKLTGIEWRNKIASDMGWNESLGKDHEWSPKSLSHYAQLWGDAMQKRQTLLHNSEIKLRATKDIIDLLDRPTLIFSESTRFADEISLLLEGKAAAYHSKISAKVYSDKTFSKLIANGVKVVEDGRNITKFKMIKSGDILEYKQVKKKFKNAVKVSGKTLKHKIIEDYNTGKLNVLSTVKALDQGLDSDRAEIAIIASGKSQSLQSTQRAGRALNHVEGKTAMIINIYIKDTQDEKWLKKRQINVPDGKIKWITDIKEIKTW